SLDPPVVNLVVIVDGGYLTSHELPGERSEPALQARLRNLPVGCQVIDDLRQQGREMLLELALRQASRLSDPGHPIRAQRVAQLIGRDRQVLSGADPRLDEMAQSALLKRLQQPGQAAGPALDQADDL